MPKQDTQNVVPFWDEHQGKKARDKVTGLEGTITGYVHHLTGCNSVILQPPVDKDGKMRDNAWFDEGRVEVLEEVPSTPASSVASEKKGACCSPPSNEA